MMAEITSDPDGTDLREVDELLDELASVGVFISDIWDLVNDRYDSSGAVEVLVRWLANLDEWAPSQADKGKRLREAIVRCLMVKSARPAAAPVLIDQFRRFGQGKSGWVIAAALEEATDDSHFDDIATFVLEDSCGRARGPLVLALGRMKDPRASSVIFQVLKDPALMPLAVIALGQLRAPEARDELIAIRGDQEIASRLTKPQRAFLYKEIAKALKRIDQVR